MVEVYGDFDELQMCVDFYLGVTSFEGVAGSSVVRDRLFNMFEEDDKLRDENYLSYDVVSDDYHINLDETPVLFGAEESFDGSVGYFGSVSLETEKTKTEIEKDNSFMKQFVLEKESTQLDNEENDFISQSSYDIVSEDEEDSFLDWDNDEVDWGSDDEEFEEEGFEDDFVNWDSDSSIQENTSNFVDCDYNSEGSVTNTQEDDSDFINWGSDSEGDGISDNIESAIHEDDSLGFFDEDFILEEYSDTLSKVVVSDVIIESPKEDVVLDVPKDLRDFVKMYPNCEVSFALKYFSKKEIDRQLNLGRVFKRKNKLLI